MSTTGFGRAMGVVALLVAAVAACDGEPPPPPPAAPAPPPAAPPVEAVPAPEPPVPAPPKAEPEPAKASIGALPRPDEATRSERLIAHYRALHCLEAVGAGPREIAAAFTASGLTPAAWDQALGELLDAMGSSPNGDIAQAIREAREQPCAGEPAP